MAAKASLPAASEAWQESAQADLHRLKTHSVDRLTVALLVICNALALLLVLIRAEAL